ncbi:MAG: DUF3307 domain-containing protein [Caldilineaceae bacterium]
MIGWRAAKRAAFTQAIFVHCAVYTLTMLAALHISTRNQSQPPPYLSFLLIVFLSHWLIDAGNLAGHWVRWWRQSRLLFVRIMVDQTLHVLVLAFFMEWWL